MKHSLRYYIYIVFFFGIFSLLLLGALALMEKSYISENLLQAAYQAESITPKLFHSKFHSEEGISEVEYRRSLLEIKKYSSIKGIDTFYILEERKGRLYVSLKLPTSTFEKQDPYMRTFNREFVNLEVYDRIQEMLEADRINQNVEAVYTENDRKYLVSMVYNRDYFGNRYIVVVGNSVEQLISEGMKRSFSIVGIVLTVLITSMGTLLYLFDRLKKREMAEIRDDLTGFYLRKYLKILEKTIHKTRNTSWGIIYADLDGLKGINDSYGHDAGDRYIVSFGNILRSTFRERDHIIRMGGDEFLVVTPLNSVEDLKIVVERLRGRKGSMVSFSLGWEYIPKKKARDFSFEDVIKRVDRSMYEDKRKNRNSFLLDGSRYL